MTCDDKILFTNDTHTACWGSVQLLLKPTGVFVGICQEWKNSWQHPWSSPPALDLSADPSLLSAASGIAGSGSNTFSRRIPAHSGRSKCLSPNISIRGKQINTECRGKAQCHQKLWGHGKVSRGWHRLEWTFWEDMLISRMWEGITSKPGSSGLLWMWVWDGYSPC